VTFRSCSLYFIDNEVLHGHGMCRPAERRASMDMERVAQPSDVFGLCLHLDAKKEGQSTRNRATECDEGRAMRLERTLLQ
jgi:hypothetical protein